MVTETSDDIQINLKINNVGKLINILLHHSKFNDDTPIETTSDRNDYLSKLYSEIRSLNRKVELGFQKTGYYLSQLNERMLNIERFIIRYDHIMEMRLSSEENFVEKSQLNNVNISKEQDFGEKKEETTISFSSVKDSANSEDFNTLDESLESGSTEIRTDGLPVFSDNICIGDFEWNNNNLKEDDSDSSESLCESCPDFIKGNVCISESEAPSCPSIESLYCEDTRYNSDSDNVSSTRKDRNSNYFDAEEFKLNNNKELPDNFEKHSNTESTNMSESSKEWINNVEPKEDKRLFGTFNKYLGTDKFYSGSMKVEFESTTSCIITYYEESNDSGPNKITEVSYKIVYNNDIGEYLLVFEEQEPMKSKLIVRINNNLNFLISEIDSNAVICEYITANQSSETPIQWTVFLNQSSETPIQWTVFFKDDLDAAKFLSLIRCFQRSY
uniref:RanBD1 domain-containing protein n=1 Tax=Strongyloides papillosus TaxID=174720 RepID=A0A0N5BRR6_STREA